MNSWSQGRSATGVTSRSEIVGGQPITDNRQRASLSYARASGAAPCRNGRGVLEASGEFKWSGTGGEHNTTNQGSELESKRHWPHTRNVSATRSGRVRANNVRDSHRVPT